MKHSYSIARFVPDPARGEAINLGIIAGSDESGEWTMRLVQNLRRASYLDDRKVLPAVIAQLTSLSQDLEAWTEGAAEAEGLEVGTDWLSQLASESANILQFTDPRPVVAENAEAAIDMIWDELVVEPTARIYRFEKKHRAVGEVRRAFRRHGLGSDRVKEKAAVMSDVHRAYVDFAVHNGDVNSLAQCWSFQLPNQFQLIEEIKAWCWTIGEIRRAGGAVDLGRGRRMALHRDVPVSVVYVPARDDDAAFEEASSAFTTLGIRAGPYDQAEQVLPAALMGREP